MRMWVHYSTITHAPIFFFKWGGVYYTKKPACMLLKMEVLGEEMEWGKNPVWKHLVSALEICSFMAKRTNSFPPEFCSHRSPEQMSA